MKLLFLSIITITIASFAVGQGCSDAGLCTTGGLDSGFGKSNPKTNLKYSTIFGLGEQNVFHITSQLELNIPVISSQVLQIKIPYNFTFGNLGNISGLGDLILSANQHLYSGENSSMQVVAGIKIPSNDANKTKDGFSLPMAYQTSLGTYDIILGINSMYKNWNFGLGYQHSFGNNLNKFEHRYDNPANFNNYNESYNLKRADDIMARIEYLVSINKTKIVFGAIPIYHLADDVIKGSQKVANSSGLTLNLIGKSHIFIKNNWIMEMVLAAPIIDKESRPDGLTRSFVAMISFSKSI